MLPGISKESSPITTRLRSFSGKIGLAVVLLLTTGSAPDTLAKIHGAPPIETGSKTPSMPGLAGPRVLIDSIITKTEPKQVESEQTGDSDIRYSYFLIPKGQ